MANDAYSINLTQNGSNADFVAVVIKNPTAATAASTGTFLPIPKFENTIKATETATATTTAATNATPIVVTATNTFSNGDVVYGTGHVGNTGANGTFTIASASGSGFTLVGSRGTGVWTSGGTFVKVTKSASLLPALQAAFAAIINDRAVNG